MVQATGQKILRKKEVKLNNFFILGSGIFMTLDSGILVDFEVPLKYFNYNNKLNIFSDIDNNNLADNFLLLFRTSIVPSCRSTIVPPLNLFNIITNFF